MAGLAVKKKDVKGAETEHLDVEKAPPGANAAMLSAEKASTPWKPYRTLDVPEHLKEPGFVYRWCNSDQKNINKKLSEQWQVVDTLSKVHNPNVPTNYGKRIDTSTTVAGMVLMKLPKRLAAERKLYYDNVTNKNTEEIHKKFKNNVPGSFGAVSIENG
jgi:hypothetical protein